MSPLQAQTNQPALVESRSSCHAIAMTTQNVPGIRFRRSEDRGHADHGWLDARHSFSFADYYDPEHMGFRTLRVINEDTIAPGKGFGMHPHRSMEIFTVIKEGSLKHQDSMGNEREIVAGEIQYMSAGSGVLHSEINPSPDSPAKLLQIWITPAQPGGAPRYQDLKLADLEPENGRALLASPDGRAGSIAIRQNAIIELGRLETGTRLFLSPDPDRPYTWLQLISGRLNTADQLLNPGDALAAEHTSLNLTATEESSFLLFHLS